MDGIVLPWLEVMELSLADVNVPSQKSDLGWGGRLGKWPAENVTWPGRDGEAIWPGLII